jgi:hypothetical protein
MTRPAPVISETQPITRSDVGADDTVSIMERHRLLSISAG